MRKGLRLNTTFAKVEFWAATTIFAFALFFFINEGLAGNGAQYQPYFEKAGIPFNFFKNHFLPQLVRNITLFGALLFLNFIVIPALVSRDHSMRNVVFCALTFLATTIICGFTGFYLKTFEYDLVNKAAA